MKRCLLALVASLILAAPLAAADKDHTGHGMNYLGNNSGNNAHQEVVDGVKATFNVKTMKDAMKEMGMELPKGMKETHHVSVAFNDVKTGKALTEGEVMVRIQGPDKVEQAKELMGMQGHFGADIEMTKKGSYGISCNFKLKDGRSRQVRFRYTVK
jgi:hypothetical protein